MNDAEEDAQGSPATALRNVAVGVVIGLNQIGTAVAMSALVFAGGSGAAGATFAALMLLASMLGTVSLISRQAEAPLLFFGPHVTSLAVLMPALTQTGAGQPAIVVFAILGLSAMIAGGVMVLLSVFDLGRIVRLMPYPVASGFLASIGLLLMIFALEIVLPGAPDALPEGWTGWPALNTMAAVGLGAVIILSGPRGGGTGPLLFLLIAVGIFFAALFLAGIDLRTARAEGLLFDRDVSLPDLGIVLWTPFVHAPEIIAQHGASLCAAALVGVLSVVMHLGGMELILNEPVDSRRVLMRSGVTNLVAGAAGSGTSFAGSAATAVAVQFEARGPLAPLAAVVTLALGVPASGLLIAYTPPFVASGLLLGIGARIFWTWFGAQYRVQPRADWSLSGVIVLVSVVYGVMTGIAVGVIAAIVIFAVTYARLPVIVASTDLTGRASTVERGPGERRWLDGQAGRVRVISLQGFLFFGSIESVLAHVRTILVGSDTPRWIILELSRVSGLDAAGLLGLVKLHRQAARREARLILTGLNAAVADAIDRNPASARRLGARSRFPDIGTAVEHVEEALLSGFERSDAAPGAEAALAELSGSPDFARRMVPAMTRQTLPAGTRLITQGDRSTDVYIIDTGQLRVETRGREGQSLRLATFRAGAIVGEMAGYGGAPRSADVVALGETVVYRVGPDELAGLMRDDPELAAQWHRAIAVSMTDKLARTTALLRH